VQTNALPGTVLKANIGEDIVSQDINVLAMVKGSERYVFLFDDSSRAETLRVLGRYASDPELSFSWQDAAVLSQRIRQEAPVSEKRFDLPLPLDQDDLL
jgi:hypothetical protein